MNLIKIADETLNACELGWYEVRSGKKVCIEDTLDQAVVGTEFIGANDDFDLSEDEDRGSKPKTSSLLEVTDETTAQAGRRLAATGDSNVAILNFASARNPGGGFLHGATAQEEDLCRVSGLYTCLSTDSLNELFYVPNKECGSSLYTDRMIYSPEVPFFRDENYDWLEEPYNLSVVTCPAPNLNRSHGAIGALKPKGIKDAERVLPQEVEEIFRRRIDRILSVMVCFGHENIVLGALGCGAFGNDPQMVAKVFKEALSSDKFKNCFDRVVFGIPDRDGVNHRVFEKCFE